MGAPTYKPFNNRYILEIIKQHVKALYPTVE